MYSKNVITIKEKENKEIVGYIPEPLAEIIHPLLKPRKVYKITYTVQGNQKKYSKARGFFEK